jgi:hypothetical protein
MAKRSSTQPDAVANVLRLLPARWALAILAVLILYALLQPRVNGWWGWNLPSIPAMLGQESTSPIRPSKEIAKSGPKKTGTETTKAKPASPKPGLKFGLLEPRDRDRFESPAGLIYAPGSEEGHRLRHLERHLVDDPQRPGPHGVFDGDMKEFLTAIDDTYRRARGHAKGTKQRSEDAETVYEAPFEKPIGYLGGALGKERGHPKLKRMRIVLRDKNVITAFPVP